jgi:hypothetical protein
MALFGANREDVPPAPARDIYVWVNGSWDWQGYTEFGRGAGIADCIQAILGTTRYVGRDGKRVLVRGGGR